MILYYHPISTPCRAVQLLSSVLNLKLDLKHVDLFKGEQLSPEFLHSHHTVPTFKDDKIILSESRAILAYLVNRYAQNTSNAQLYPTDPVKRAYVDQALYWEASSLYPAIKAVIYPIVKSLDTKLNESNLKLVYDKLILLNEDLGRSSFIAGDELTIADLSLLAVWTGIEATGFWKTEQLGNVHAWCKRLQDSGRITNWNEIAIGSAKAYGDLIRSKLNSN